MAALPYVTATGNIERALKAIKAAATPESVSQDFVKTILKIPGGSGNQITSYLKKIGFVNADGTPSDIYKRFRNSASSVKPAGQALKIGYAPLSNRNEYMHQLTDDKLRGLVIEETGKATTQTCRGSFWGASKQSRNSLAGLRVRNPIRMRPRWAKASKSVLQPSRELHRPWHTVGHLD